jgi:hypothetical protein
MKESKMTPSFPSSTDLPSKNGCRPIAEPVNAQLFATYQDNNHCG